MVSGEAVGGGRQGTWGRAVAFHLTGLLLAPMAFVVVLPPFVLGVSTMIVWVGLPVLALTLSAATWLAQVERAQVLAYAGLQLPAQYETTDRLLGRLGETQRWRDLVHAVFGFPVRIFLGSLALGWLTIGVGFATFAAWGWMVPTGDVSGLYGLVTGDNSAAMEIVVNTLIGLVALLLMPSVMRTCAAARVRFARLVLVDHAAQLRAAAGWAEASRRASVSAEQHTLTRVERDLHDGPQQRLVRLTMDLETARRRLADDPGKVDGILGGALEQSRETLAEIRALTRGIAPPVRSERGLAHAVTAAAARCPAETTVDVEPDIEQRLTPELERTIYFFVAEALTNVAKHAQAGRAEVSIRRDGDDVTVRVLDDGRGGASTAKGHGLAGLADRVRAVGSRLVLSSPRGGPTELRAAFHLPPELS